MDAAAKIFADGLKRFNDDARRAATAQVRRVGMKSLELIVGTTPVLTGCCRGNWVVSFGPSFERTFSPTKLDKSGGATISICQAKINSAALGVDVNLENTTPYAIALEYGWSRQAPAGMVALNVALLKAALSGGAR